MRHHRDHRHLSRTAEHRRALMRRLVTALFEHERIETTVAKAKEARRVAERMITCAKRNDLHSRRLVARVVQDEDVAKKLFDVIAPWYTTRPGGYTRILKTRRRLGDAGEMGILELVKSEEQKELDRKKRAARAAAKEAAKETKRKEMGGEPAEVAEEEAAEKKVKKPRAKAKAKKKDADAARAEDSTETAETAPADGKAEATPKAKAKAKPKPTEKKGLLGRVLGRKKKGGDSDDKKGKKK